MGTCTAEGLLDASKFSGPLLWVGLYIAAASLVCCLGMAMDVIQCLRNGVFQFETRYFPLNAATLTFLSVATKFAVDLNTGMPGRADQLSKLSSLVFVCVAMNHFIPSLGSMSNASIVANVVALVILVVTVIANVCIQMGTGVIYTFIPEHAIVVWITLTILVLLLSTAYTTPAMKYLLGVWVSNWRPNVIRDEKMMCSPSGLEEFIGGYSVGAGAASPQYAISRCEKVACSTILCFLEMGILVQATARSFLGDSVEFCNGSSDYRWSTTLVLIIQAAAIFFGTVALTYRCMTTIPVIGEFWAKLEVEFWLNTLTQPKKAPAPHSRISIRRWWAESKAGYKLKFHIVNFLFVTQIWITLFNRIVLLIPYTFPTFWSKVRCSVADPVPDSVDFGSGVTLRSREVVFCIRSLVETTEAAQAAATEAVGISIMLQQANNWIQKGKKMRPTKLIELITQKHSHSMSGFHGVLALISDDVISQLFVPQYREEMSMICSWALPVVSLASIAIKISNGTSGSDKDRIAFLIEAIREGLRYVSFIDSNCMEEGTLGHEVDDTDQIWRSINKHTFSPPELWCYDDNLELYSILQNNYWGRNPYHFMSVVRYTIEEDRTTNQRCDGYPYLPRTDDNMFDWIEMTLADIMRACLTNLPAAMRKSCVNCSFEEMEGNAKVSAFFCGQLGEDIIGLLCNESSAVFLPHEKRESSFHAWRSHLRMKVQSQKNDEKDEGDELAKADGGEIVVMLDDDNDDDQSDVEEGDEENQKTKSSFSAMSHSTSSIHINFK